MKVPRKIPGGARRWRAAAVASACAVLVTSAEDPAPSSAGFRFPEKLHDGTPAPVPAPAARLAIGAADVLRSRTRFHEGRRIVVHEVRPVALPPQPGTSASR